MTEKYFSLSAIKEDFDWLESQGSGDITCREVIERLENRIIKESDVAPVVHARWEWFDEEVGSPLEGSERDWGWRCSACKDTLNDEYDNPDNPPNHNYCPNCGSRMDGEQNAAD